jgi:MFS superfamily sulfate permease-like transporter
MNYTYFKEDLKAGLVVFLVALPLCMGIALASGAPLFAGIISGIIGGIVAGALSGSSLSVSGPAAGLTTIVAVAILDLGSYPAFLLCVVIAGIFQIAFGFLKAGTLGHFFPVSVIKGMLAAIGLILILKQIPHALGYDADFEGDERFSQGDGQNTFTEILNSWDNLSAGAVIISALAILILVSWETPGFKKIKWIQFVPSPLIVVGMGILGSYLFNNYILELAINPNHMVALPKILREKNLLEILSFPDFSMWNKSQIYMTAGTIALVASLETLLNIEATDKFDPVHRITPLNRELKAQGVANVITGLLGGLPITSVIVRSSTNITAGARTKAATVLHGAIMLLTVLLIPRYLETIPLACLAGLLIVVGYKLTRPVIYQEMWKKGWSQFLPFAVTVLAVLFTDLLLGVFCGILVAVFFILKNNFSRTVILVGEDNRYLLTLTKDVSFLSKATVRDAFFRVPANSYLRIDGSKAQFIDDDIKEAITDFMETAKAKRIEVELKNIIISA